MLDFFNKKGNDDSEEIVLIEEKIPKHIAIIMDGNGRWAKKEVFQELWDIELVSKL